MMMDSSGERMRSSYYLKLEHAKSQSVVTTTGSTSKAAKI